MNLEDRVRVASLRDGWQADRVSYRQPHIQLHPDQVAEEGMLLLLLVLSREVAAREEAARQPRRRTSR